MVKPVLVRVEEDLWRDVKAAAARRGVFVGVFLTEVLRGVVLLESSHATGLGGVAEAAQHVLRDEAGVEGPCGAIEGRGGVTGGG